jgi:small-conductance mechanosensitive channel
MKLWNAMLGANSAADFALALGLLLAVPLVFALARRFASRLLREGIPAAAVRATNSWLLLPVAVYAAALSLELPPRAERIAALGALLALLVQAGLWASRALGAWFELRFRDARTRDPDGATTLKLLGFAAQGALWLLVALLALDQLGFDVTALIAGLGVGGVALALAVQNILGDVFACAAIALDKPFVVGDFIVVDGLRGTVESVGLKTTRVRSLDGELLVLANADLLKSRLRNFKQLRERRIQFGLGVTYDTPADKLRRIPSWLREAVEAQPKTRFDRAHFRGYGDSALELEVVYHVLEPDYNVYMDVQQSLNLAIHERFAAEGVEFAFPTRTLLVKPDPSGERKLPWPSSRESAMSSATPSSTRSEARERFSMR